MESQTAATAVEQAPTRERIFEAMVSKIAAGADYYRVKSENYSTMQTRLGTHFTFETFAETRDEAMKLACERLARFSSRRTASTSLDKHERRPAEPPIL